MQPRRMTAHARAPTERCIQPDANRRGDAADLIERGLQPDIARLFIVDGAKALSRAVRDTFGGFALIQRYQVHKGRNIIERLYPSFLRIEIGRTRLPTCVTRI